MITIKYKLYKSDKFSRLDGLSITSCYIWNHALALQKRYYRLYGGYIQKGKMRKHIAKLRNKSPRWLKLGSQAVQEILDRLDKGYSRFFNKIASQPPKFKRTRNSNSFTYQQHGCGYKIVGNRLIISKIGVFRFKKTRHYENLKTLTIKKDNLGDWYIYLVCDMEPVHYKREGNSSIGMDFGLKTYLTCSNGIEIESPQFYKQSEKNLKILHKKLSSKQKGSNNRLKAKKNLARAYKKMTNQREDHQWKLAHELCKQNELICIEDLNIVGMKKLWGKKVSDLAFSEFITRLEYVATKYGTTIQKIDRFYPSSKLCTCGVKNTELTLKDREWTCKSCGTTHKRDLLAANNILTEGIRLYCTKQKTSILEAV